MALIQMGDHRRLVNELKRQGWTVTQTSRGHYKSIPPKGGEIVHFSDSADPHAWRNTIAQLTKSGFYPDGAPKTTSEVPLSKCPACGSDFDTVAAMCLGKCGEEPDLDTLWDRLKEAKELHALSEEDVTKAKAALVEAQQRVDSTLKDLQTRAAVLRRVKEKFDKEFSG